MIRAAAALLLLAGPCDNDASSAAMADTIVQVGRLEYRVGQLEGRIEQLEAENALLRQRLEAQR